MTNYIKFDINKKLPTPENKLVSHLFLTFLSFPNFSLTDFAFLIRGLELDERIEDSPIIPFPSLEDEILHFLQELREERVREGKEGIDFLASNFSRAMESAYYFLTREQQEVLLELLKLSNLNLIEME